MRARFLAMTVVCLASALAACGPSPSTPADSKGPASAGGAAKGDAGKGDAPKGDAPKGDPAKGDAAKGAGAPAMPPAEVAVIITAPEAIALVADLPGRLEALRTAQVRARVPGIVQQRVFQEGADVRQGDVLYRIDPAAFQAALDSAQATLARAEATLMLTGTTAERYAPLAQANAISRQEYTNAQGAFKQAEADVAAGKAAVQTARINLGYATITAPIAGRIGRTQVSEGALVGQGDATPLALIQQVDPLYVNFTQPVADVLRLRQSIGSGGLKAADPASAARVRVVLDDGSPYPHAGKLLFSDLAVDPASGQVTLRAQLPNPQALLLPGMYVRVRLEQGRNDNALALPQQAVTRGAQGDTVMVVDDKGMVTPRPVKIAMGQGNRWVVTEGLQAGEKVIVEGFQKLRPGAPVRTVPWKGPAGARPAAAAATPGAPAAGK